MNTTRITASLLTRCLCIRMMLASRVLVAQTAHEHASHPVSITALDSLAIETARLAARYKDRAVAMREGYRRVGTDFPGMGEHFVNTRALPFSRAGIAAPANVEADIGRAFSLEVGGDKYLQDVLSDAGIRTTSNSEAIDAAVGDARAPVEKLAEPAKRTGASESGEEVRLKAVWTTLSNQLRALLGARVQPCLAPPHGGKHSTDSVDSSKTRIDRRSDQGGAPCP